MFPLEPSSPSGSQEMPAGIRDCSKVTSGRREFRRGVIHWRWDWRRKVVLASCLLYIWDMTREFDMEDRKEG